MYLHSNETFSLTSITDLFFSSYLHCILISMHLADLFEATVVCREVTKYI